MKHTINRILLACLLPVALMLFAGCAGEQTPYQLNDSENYTVSVKFDANGGTFTTNTSVIVDSFNLEEIPSENGTAHIALIPPDHEARGRDAFPASYNGHFLAGWYQERIESQDSQGNTVYTYAKPWNFETDTLDVAVDGSYSSAQPELTLYAAWIPLFQVEFCDADTGEILYTHSFDPVTQGTQLQTPAWSQETGTLEMYHFPEKKGCTYQEAYYENASDPITGQTLTHPGTVDLQTGTAQNTVLRLNVAYTEGEWYHIYNVDQFLDNVNLNGHYVLHADLDFTGKIWPTVLVYGNFTGSIQGNGYTISNVQVTQTNNSKSNAGLFGRLTETARLEQLHFRDITFTVESGTRVAGTSYGLLAGVVSSDAVISEVTVESGAVQIDAGAYFGTDDYVIGLISGMGTADIDFTGITCAVVGEATEPIYVYADDNGQVHITDTPPAEDPNP